MFSNLALSLLLSCTGPFEPMNGFQIPDIRSAIRAMNQSFSKGGLPCFSSDNVEYSRLINSKKDGETLLYFDLSGDNGYLVFDTEGNLQGFSVLGDWPALREREHVSFANFEFFDEHGVSIGVFGHARCRGIRCPNASGDGPCCRRIHRRSGGLDDLTCLSSFGTAFDRASSMSIATCTIIENM